VCEVTDGVIYLAAAMRNVGSGIAVLHGWYLHPEQRLTGVTEHAPLEEFHRLTRDLYIAPGEVGFWQGAFRDPSDPGFAAARAAIEEPRRIGVEILYGDHELGRRSISLFLLTPREDGAWIVSVARHWNVDGAAPR
jgi:hypothetical protein